MQHFLRHGIKSTQGNNVPGERISHPVAIGELASGGGIENLIPQTSKGKIAVLHIRCGHRSELAGGLFLNQLLISEKEESLVTAVIEFGKHYRPAHVGLRQLKLDLLPVGRAGARLRIPVLVEEQAVLHATGATKFRRQTMQFIGPGLLHNVNHTTRRMAIFGRQRRGENLNLGDGVLDGLDGAGAIELIVSHHTVFENAEMSTALPGKVIAADATSIGVSVGGHTRH